VPGVGLDRVDRLDPKRSEPPDERVAVVAQIVGAAPPAGFQIAQQPAKLGPADRADLRAGSKPDQPQGTRARKRDRCEAAFGRGRQAASLLVDLTGHLKGRNRPVGQVRLKVVQP
jgi:hypothetical protein